jgi:hypothetical protein
VLGEKVLEDKTQLLQIFFLYMFLANQRFIFRNFLLCHRSQMSARSQVSSQGATHQEIWQSAVGLGDAGFEPGLLKFTFYKKHQTTNILAIQVKHTIVQNKPYKM